MDIFLSWSGDKSRKAAESFRDWLPNVIQALKPYFTPNDINKGQRWSQDLSNKLDSSQFGLILLTTENLNAPWILFEAGALSKNIGVSSVCPILLDLKTTDLSGPLAQFQASIFNKVQIFKVIESINTKLENSALPDKTLEIVFNKWWPDLEGRIQNILNEDVSVKNEVRTERELIEDTLRLVRRLSYSSFESKDIYEKLTYMPVSYDEDSKTIKVWLSKHSSYDIELDRLCSSAELLDFILQINAKRTTKPDHIKAFLDCLEELTDRYFKKNAQGIFCPFGETKDVEWPNN